MVYSIPSIVRKRAQLLGKTGETWLNGLDASLATLSARWNLASLEQLPGGSESLVFSVICDSGKKAVLKLMLPTTDPVRPETLALKLAGGHGYAQLLESADEHDALLLEQLGQPIGELDLSIDQQLPLICSALAESWDAPVDPGLSSGINKADWLEAHFSNTPKRLTISPRPELINGCLDYLHQRRQAWRPETFCLVHGDAHEHNALLLTNDKAMRKCKLVDPDGLLFEPAYDLGILMRNWHEQYQHPQAATIAQKRCELLASITGIDAVAIWQWGVIEIASTGLHLAELNYELLGQAYLDIAETLLSSD